MKYIKENSILLIMMRERKIDSYVAGIHELLQIKGI